MAKRKRNNMLSTSVQFTDEQFTQLDEIENLEQTGSIAQTVRNAVDYYIENKYPQLMNN